MECKVYEFDTQKNYKYADIFAMHNGKWIFCRHKERDTWENPGGHIEIGETALEAARRELYEETGAISFNLIPLCDYWIFGEFNGITLNANGQVYFADVTTLDNLPQSEMAEIRLLDSLPCNLTTLNILMQFFRLLQKWGILHNVT